MERIGIYSETFDPPQSSHVLLAQSALKDWHLDRLIVIPRYASRPDRIPVASPTRQQQLEMSRLAFADIAQVALWEPECGQEDANYAEKTAEQLYRQYPQASFIVWPQSEADAQVLKEALAGLDATVCLAECPGTQLTGVDLFRMISFGCGKAVLPEKVADYICRNRLYGYSEYRDLPMDQLETAVVSLLKPSRVNHVLGCRDTAVALAKKWGANQRDAARAGLLHDITKALDGPLQLTLCSAYGTMLDDFSVQNPKTLHALTGSLVAQHIFGENEAVVAAICSHTTGKANMNLLEKIIYVADYMEPNRDFPGVDELRELAFRDIDLALKTGLEMTIAMLRQQDREISKGSQEALQWLESLKG